MILTTVQLTEVLWLLAAIPGLYLWSRNRVVAGKDRRIAKQLDVEGGPLRWARFEVDLTNTFVAIEALFVGIGVLSMTQPQNAAANEAVRWIISLGLIGMSFGITLLGRRWLRVHETLIEVARSMVGEVGPAGETGAAGAVGRTGEAGAPGIAGAAGRAGEVGARGSAGEAGESGTPGAAGSVGSTGSTGATGREPSVEEIDAAVRRYMDARSGES